MADNRYTAEEQALFDQEYQKKLQSELSSVREEEIRAAAQRAAELEVEQRRDVWREELDSKVTATTTESATELRDEANRETPSKLVLGIVLLILFLFLLAVFGQLPGFGSNSADRSSSAADNAVINPILSGQQATPVGLAAAGSTPIPDPQTGRGLPNAGGVDGLGTIATIDPNINELFRPYYQSRDGLRLFGKPISPLLVVNGRQVQWFERSRLEYWPEYAGTSYEVQPGLVGSEYTDGRNFPQQSFFTNRPGLRFFGETSHGVSGRFLEYYDAYGGLDTFGYPISDEIVEILPETKRYHTVQYFQRARMELHSELAGTGDDVQLGLLGRALYLNDAKSTPTPPVAPTTVSIP